MINKNQFEKSVIFINTELPGFIRKLYTDCYQCIDELFAQLMNSASKSEYSVNETVNMMINNRRFMFVYSKVFSKDVLDAKFKHLYAHNRVYDKFKTMSADEMFYTVNGADIYAPVKSIDIAVTPYAYLNTEHVVPIMFEVSDTPSLSSSERLLNDYGSYGYNNNGLEIEGFNGNKTVLDNLESVMSVDAINLFDRFFGEIIEATDQKGVRHEEGDNDSGAKGLDILTEILDKFKDPTISNNILEKITKKMLASAISTYLIYASKLIGAKNDVYSWAYTAFVKDSLSTLDKALYPGSINISDVSGHTADKYRENIDGNGQYEDSSIREDIRKRPSDYNNIKLQYSVWSACITAIMSDGFKRLAIDRNIRNSNSSEVLSISSKIWDTDFAHICDYITRSLLAYLAARYRTYNTSQSMDYTNGALYQSVKNIKYAVSKIKDEEAAAVIKNSAVGFKISDIYISTSTTDYSILSLNKFAVSSLSRMFLYGAYLYMLSIIKAKLGRSYTEIEPNTGKTKQVLFEEIYNGVCNRICDTLKNSLSNFSIDSIQFMNFSASEKTLLTDICKKYTPFSKAMDLYNNRTINSCFDILDEQYHSPTYGIIENITVTSAKDVVPETLKKVLEDEHGHYLDCFKNYLKIPFFVDMGGLRTFTEYFERKNVAYDMNFETGPSINKDDPIMFPRNQVVLDSISKMNLSTSAYNRAFRTLESADSTVTCLESASDLTVEGADAMANNGCYSALGSLCGGVRSLEITNDENASINVDGSNVNAAVTEDSPTDASGRIISEGTSDTLDQATITQSTESVRNNMLNDIENRAYQNINNRFDDLFDKMVLGK